MTGSRAAPARKADTLAQLGAAGADVWVASASAAAPYLVPLSLAWVEERVVVAAEVDSRTVRNIVGSGTARLGLGPTRDVVMIDAVLDRVVPVAEAGTLADRYADQAGWDPRSATYGDYVYLVLRLDRIQAWREVDEIPGRTLMRAGSWLV